MVAVIRPVLGLTWIGRPLLDMVVWLLVMVESRWLGIVLRPWVDGRNLGIILWPLVMVESGYLGIVLWVLIDGWWLDNVL